MPGERIVLATIGSLGDLYPFLAIGRALAERGARPVIAGAESHMRFVEAAGLEGAPIYPDIETYVQAAGYEDFESWTERAAGDPDFLLREGALRFLPQSAAALDRIAEGADGVVGSSLAFAAPMVAERRGLPFVAAVLSPMLLFLTNDPPTLPGLPPLARKPRTPLHRRWNDLIRTIVALEMRRRFGRDLKRTRRDLGLEGSGAVPLFAFGRSGPARLGLFSPQLLAADARLPAEMNVTGYCWRQSREPMPEGLSRFLDDGPPPLVFSLGSFAVFAERGFYERSVEAARRLGRRAVLLTGMERPVRPVAGDDVYVADYAPHEDVFPRAAAVIHHGGVGTSARALAAGVPQLVVPHLGDQWDNAARLERLGLALSLDHEDYKVEAAAGRLATLTKDLRYAEAAREQASIVGREDGAGTAAEEILARLARRPAA
ncbi:glycosyltransferase [Parvularcula dongshanensis]|uniref:UDP:flavonoid glycosyltransferase YjiC (YdhE family) n=1 Tax=Parvularcula dongshanensis TaxID=1173995 RepID=A0A840I351_9PROT|nr:nucleotide disphospho-sugar-binding domain-containing protein [Parvularcula dongshanensis]MBB4659436.1 UDP:flavonoid glycosyltransferase YjiC (YdhE family) [Parvularcula dongshanensis]